MSSIKNQPPIELAAMLLSGKSPSLSPTGFDEDEDDALPGFFSKDEGTRSPNVSVTSPTPSRTDSGIQEQSIHSQVSRLEMTGSPTLEMDNEGAPFYRSSSSTDNHSADQKISIQEANQMYKKVKTLIKDLKKSGIDPTFTVGIDPCFLSCFTLINIFPTPTV